MCPVHSVKNVPGLDPLSPLLEGEGWGEVIKQPMLLVVTKCNEKIDSLSRGTRHGVNQPPAPRTQNLFLYGLASRMRLKGVSVARRKRVNPPAMITSRKRASPACAPRPSATSWLSEAGVQTNVDIE